MEQWYWMHCQLSVLGMQHMITHLQERPKIEAGGVSGDSQLV
jgi:hypothetical protein